MLLGQSDIILMKLDSDFTLIDGFRIGFKIPLISMNYFDFIGSSGAEYSYDVLYSEDSDSILICGTTFDNSFF